ASTEGRTICLRRSQFRTEPLVLVGKYQRVNGDVARLAMDLQSKSVGQQVSQHDRELVHRHIRAGRCRDIITVGFDPTRTADDEIALWKSIRVLDQQP